MLSGATFALYRSYDGGILTAPLQNADGMVTAVSGADGSVSFTGGTVIVNGKEQTQITGSMMKGQGMGMQNDGSMPQGGMNGGMHRRA